MAPWFTLTGARCHYVCNHNWHPVPPQLGALYHFDWRTVLLQMASDWQAIRALRLLWFAGLRATTVW